jgi:hypothetical protein
MKKGMVISELILVLGLLAVAYLLYVQQEQIAELELEIDRVRGAVTGGGAPVPAAEPGAGAAGV